MLTKYAKDCMKVLRDNCPIPNVGNNAVATVEIKSYLGESKYTQGKPYSGVANTLITSARTQETAGVAIGTGDTPATEDDYDLESQITSGISGSAVFSTEYDSTDNILTERLTVTVSNTGETDIAISEIGFITNFATASKGSNVSSSPRFACLMDRTVLDTPITIPAGQAGVIYYDFIMDGGSVSSRAMSK